MQRVKDIIKEEGKENLRLRVAVDAGGCSGFQYTFELDDELDDEEDFVFAKDGVEVVTDSSSLEYLEVILRFHHFMSLAHGAHCMKQLRLQPIRIETTCHLSKNLCCRAPQ